MHLRVLLLVMSLAVMLPIAVLAARDDRAQRKNLYVLKSYAFLPVEKSGHEDLGAALCGTRCSALSMDYLTYTTPGGYYLQKVADSKILTVDLDNPYLKGQCACEVDEYVLKVNDLYMVPPTYPETDSRSKLPE